MNNWKKGTQIPHLFLFQRLLEMREEVGLKNVQNGQKVSR